MAQYFAALLVLFLSVGSLATTTKPQAQQKTDASKNLCEKSIIGHGFPGIPGSNGMPGMPGVPGTQGPQGRDGAKGHTGDKGAEGMPGKKGERGPEGYRGKSGPPGMMGIKGESGIVGAQGKKGEKGEKGESVKASPASAVPRTNWKQCAWKQGDSRDSGKIKDCSFNKLQSDTALKVSFQGNTRVESDNRCNRWYFKFNGNECSGPTTIEAIVYSNWPSSVPNLLYHRSFEGYCENIPQGAVRVELWVGQCSGQTLGDAYTGWNSVSRIIIEEVSRPQS